MSDMTCIHICGKERTVVEKDKYLQGVGEVDVVVASETAEVGHNTLSGRYFVVVESPALPLGQRKGNLELDILEIAGSEGGGALSSVQVVVETRSLGQEHGARDTLKIHVCLELILEGGLDEGECLLFLEKTFDGRLVSVFEYGLGWETGHGFLGVESSSHGCLFSKKRKVVLQSGLALDL
jgi:hypothetical protein